MIIDAESPFTYRHSTGMARVSVGIAEALGLTEPQIKTVERAALLHDIGKLGIPNTIWDKPGRLTADEYDIVKSHPRLSEQILRRIAAFSDLAGPVGQHHERLDGLGYHRGIRLSQYSIVHRLLPVADGFDALTAKRPCRDPTASRRNWRLGNIT